MSQSFSEILSTYSNFIAFALATALLVVIVVRYWDRVSLWWLNVIYSLPVVGKLRRLSRDIGRAREDAWSKSERTLCMDYKRHLKVADQNQYLECQLYLEKAGDAGRTPFPIAIWILIVGLVFVEAMGFSYVLAGWTVPGASENTQVYASYGIAFMLSVLLVALTHLAGHELHKSNAIRNARTEWRENPDAKSFRSDDFYTLQVTLADPTKSQSRDDHHPKYTQLANRVGTKPTYWVSALTAVFVLAVAIFATYVRNQTFELQQIEETSGMNDPFFGNTPEELAQTQADADKKAAEDSRSTKSTASMSTFILLAVVFVFLQILGVVFGMRWGFAGRESQKAYHLSGGSRFSSFDEYREHFYDRVADQAQAKLETLRQLMAHRNEHGGNVRLTFTPHTFRDFVHEQHSKNRALAASATKPVAQPVVRAEAAVAPPPPAARPAVPVPPPLKTYRFTDTNNQPSANAVTLSELEELYAAGAITLTTWTLEEGAASWVAFKDLRSAGSAAPAPMPSA